MSAPYMTWTSLEGIDPSYERYFDKVFDLARGHQGKLNNLALEISAQAKPDELANTPWLPILKSNRAHFDPLFFTVYGDTIYHHGAGFRRGGASRGFYDRAPKRLPRPQSMLLRQVTERIDKTRNWLWRMRHRGPQIMESKRIFAKIERDDPDWIDYIS